MRVLKFGGVALSNFEAVLSIVGEKIRQAEPFTVILSASDCVINKLVEAIQSRFQACRFVDARELIATDNAEKSIRAYFAAAKGPQIITDFVAATEHGEAIAPGRGSSDYTAALIASALKATEIEIWTTVNGFMSADPVKVKTALTIAKLHYDEGLELAQFGARIIHPLAVQRAAQAQIPIRIRNVLAPAFAGSLISNEAQREHSVTGVSSISNVSLVLVEGIGVSEVTELARRFFAALERAKSNVLLTSQGCAQHALCVAVPPEQAAEAVAFVRDEFAHELERNEVELSILPEHSVVAVVGLNMQHSPGTSGKFFQALGRNGINVVTIAQGSSELNISAVIARKDESKALNAIHETFFLAEQKTLNIFVVGVGSVGGKLLEQIAEQAATLRSHKHLDVRIVALANSRHVLFNADGLSLAGWREQLKTSTQAFHLADFIKLMKEANLPNSIFVDCTASKDVAQKYEDILRASISIVTPNKKANASSLAQYRALRQAATKANVKFFYETNVGAGLPVIGTLNDLINSGDEIVKIEAVLSGTLSYIFNSFGSGTTFSAIVKDAKARGYTEPDPRDDLSGMDVARKLLILGREMGLPLEEDAVTVESLISENCRAAQTVEKFFAALEREDPEMELRRKRAADKGEILRYIGIIANGKATVSLQTVGHDHPFYSLSGSDNVISFSTKRYNERPLVVKGPGAGTDVTAAGILADILRVSSYLT